MSDHTTLPTEKSRLVFVDALRGFALLGILWVHQPIFKDLSNGFMDKPSDLSLLEQWIHVLGTGSFYPIFAFLFGWGLATQFPNLDETDLRNMKRRLWALFGIGAIHAIFIWQGDILNNYAITGFYLLRLAQKENSELLLKMKRLLIWGTVFGIFFYTFIFGDAFFPSNASTNNAENPFGDIDSLIRSGPYFSVVIANIGMFVLMLLFNRLYAYFSSLPLFILGFVVGREKIFQQIESYLSFLKKWVIPALIVGLGLKLLELTPYPFLKAIGIAVGAPVLSVGYVFAFILLWQMPTFQKILFPFQYVGKMGLTSYILHSLICTLIYYGYGLSGYAWITDAQSMVVVVLVYGAILAFSMLWQKYFRFGILEWLWKWATYQERPLLSKN